MATVVTLPNMDNLLTTAQAADRMGCSVDYLRRLRNGGWLKEAGRVGSTVLYSIFDVDEYIRSHPGLGTRRKVI